MNMPQRFSMTDAPNIGSPYAQYLGLCGNRSWFESKAVTCEAEREKRKKHQGANGQEENLNGGPNMTKGKERMEREEQICM